MDDIERWLQQTIDERFYDSFPREYFGNSLMLALAALQSPTRTLSVLTEDQDVGTTDAHDAVLLLRLDANDINEEDYRRTAKLQIANLYYHACETLVRLFLAHRPSVSHPWLEMARETDFRRFKQKAEKISRWESEWDGLHEEDEWVRFALWPEREPSEEHIRILTAAKRWLLLAANETIDGPAYNAFKHGLGLQAGQESLGLYRKGEDPRESPEAKPILEMKGDALIILRREKESDGSWNWVRETRWLRLREKVAVIHVLQRWYLPGILDVGAARYLDRPFNHIQLPNWGPSEALRHLKTTEGPELLRFSQGLGLAERPAGRGKKRRR